MLIDDLNKLSGIEFENLCAQLVSNLGFQVEMTKASGDGGIDIIAFSDLPLYSGKYIIQCKRYSGAVGEPILRDLYGVITSERANKGILITTGTFTTSAKKFSEGKNIELIDGVSLKAMISKQSYDTSSVNKQTQTNFNHERYNYLKSFVSENPKSYKAYTMILDFLWGYFWRDDNNSCIENDIFSKIISINRAFSKKWNGKKDNILRSKCRANIINVYTVTGNLGKATSMLLEDERFYIKNWRPIVDIYNKSNIVYYQEMQARNLFSAFKQVGFQQGCELLLSMPQKLICYDGVHGIPWPDEEQDLIASVSQEKAMFLSGHYDDIFFHTDTGDLCALFFDKSKSKRMSLIKNYYFQKQNDEIQFDIIDHLKQHNIFL